MIYKIWQFVPKSYKSVAFILRGKLRSIKHVSLHFNHLLYLHFLRKYTQYTYSMEFYIYPSYIFPSLDPFSLINATYFMYSVLLIVISKCQVSENCKQWLNFLLNFYQDSAAQYKDRKVSINMYSKYINLLKR